MRHTTTSQSPKWHSALTRQLTDHGERELGGARAVDDAMVERHRDVPDRPHYDLTVAHDRSLGDPVHAEDRDLRVVHERRHEDAAELAGARHREGRTAQLGGLERSGARTLGEAIDLAAQLVDRTRVCTA